MSCRTPTCLGCLQDLEELGIVTPRRRERQLIVTRLTPAERLLQELGITEPKEIDLEAVAFHLGARVRYRRLEGCEAQIIGRNDAAIITIGEGCHACAVSASRSPMKLGTGPIITVRRSSAGSRNPDHRTGCLQSASPTLSRLTFLCRGICSRLPRRAHPKLNFKTVDALAASLQDKPDSNRNSPCRRGSLPCPTRLSQQPGPQMVHQRAKLCLRDGFPKTPSTPRASPLASCMVGNADDAMPRKIGAEAWFDRWTAANHEVHEQTIRTGEDEILTLILISDPRMLDDSNERIVRR